MKSKKVITSLDCGIFPGYISFSCGFSRDEYIEQLKKDKALDWIEAIQYDEKLMNNSTFLTMHRIVSKKNKPDVNFFYIFIRNPFEFTDYNYCKLAHEVLHVCQYCLRYLDIHDEDECMAYFHTHIMNQCLKILRS